MNPNSWNIPAAAPAQNNNSMVQFVNDDNMAVNYPISPGMTAAIINLSNPEKGRLYLKSTEINGCPNPTRIFEIKEITPQRRDSNFVSRQEYDQMAKDMQTMKGLLEAALGKMKEENKNV